MGRIPEKYLEKVYAGWLGKMIGIRHGAPIEGWEYERIRREYGEIDGYLVDYRDFAADDDSNGPLFFLRGLETAQDPCNPQPADVAQALLNYAPYEHGFFWWGGYGRSTEHTAYLNLRSGIPAPASGSIAQNGAAVAEQIGGQIFIDTWGLVSPGNPEQAARLARAAASVMHDGNGIYGGIFVAVCISLAFLETDPETLIRKALDYIPADCEYARVVHAVLDYHLQHGENWRDCFAFLHDHFGYDRYPGNCHIIPNAGVIVLALLYGEGDFGKTINICNMCGWDTDCNVGNAATIMGVLCGTEGIDYEKWIAPVHDLLICSSVVGSLNIMDIPYGASYIASWAYRLAGETMPEPLRSILNKGMDACHFEYPASTHSIRTGRQGEYSLSNSEEQARTGKRSLKAVFQGCSAGESISLYKKTYYSAGDFYDSRYDPAFSPLLYPGQTIHASVLIPEGAGDVFVCVYAKDGHGQTILSSPKQKAVPGEWMDLAYRILPMQGALIEEAGIRAEPAQSTETLTVFLDDLYFDGAVDYSVLADRETEEVWTFAHREITQFTRLKGLWYPEGGWLHLSCADFGEAYTGRHDWKDYEAVYKIRVHAGQTAYVNFRVQGAMRSYAAGFDGEGCFALLKNESGYRRLAAAAFPWEKETEYEIRIRVNGNEISACCGTVCLTCKDPDRPYLEGAVGLSVRKGTHVSLKEIDVKG